MLAVHALWSPGRGVLLWGEDGGRPVTSRSQAVRSARPHPFAAAAEVLATIHPGKPTAATLLLPSLRTAPLDSPELVRPTPRPGSRTGPALVAWSVPALAVDPSELEDPADDVRYGASVVHLREVLAFAADLTDRGRVVPAVGTSPLRAIWRPLLTGPDALTWNALVAAMPPVCRAEQAGAPGVAVLTGRSGQDPIGLATDALDTLVDSAVRDRLARAAPLSLAPPRRGRRPARQPAVEAWLEALTAADGRFTAEPADVRALAGALTTWEEAGAQPAGEARVLFRLTETALLDDPADPDLTLPDTAWHLEFLLQATADPSLLVPAEQVWAGTGQLRRWISQPQELLLAELGRASQVYPELVPALRGATPSVLELDTEGAHGFLSDAAGRLDAAGFGVQLPSWWDRRRRLGLAVAGRSAPTDGVVTEGGMNRDALAAFRWGLAVGDAVLTEDEISELVAAKAPLVRLRGQWVALDPDRLARGLEFLRRPPPAPTTPAELLALALTHPDDHGTPLPVTAVAVDGWLGDLLDGAADRTLTPLDPPAGFAATLRPYQQRGLSWLAFLSSLGIGACLADDMGLGKTVQLLALEARERADPALEQEKLPPTLLVCPMSLVGNWQREAARFAPTLRVYAHHGVARHRGDALREHLAGVDLAVTTYATAARDAEELGEAGWYRIVLDEAQAIKNSNTTVARAVRALPAGHRIALTGTPLENRLAELWSVMDFLNPGVLGSTERFRRRYAIPVERHGDADAAELLRRVTRPYLLRRVKTDPDIAGDLPEKIEIRQDYRLTVEQATLYRTVVDDMMEKIEGSDGIARRGNVLAAMAKLKQVCNHPAQLLHDGSPIGRRSGKVVRLEEILGEILAEGDRVLCFTQFTEFAEMLVPHLAARFDQDVLFLHGGTPRRRRDEMVQRFQTGGVDGRSAGASPGGPGIFLLSLKAGGTGLNLTAANHVVHLDRWWNPAVENQATDRAFRIGQRRNVAVHKFVCAGTLEERIDTMIEKKKALADMVISDGEGWLTELSTGQLREVFALSAEAVDE